MIPSELFGQFDDEAQELILAHELAQIRRGDHWVRALELVASVLYWWHPVVWWARRELRQWEELSCDVVVATARPNASRADATALLDTVEFVAGSKSPLPVLTTGATSTRSLKRRIEMLRNGRCLIQGSRIVRWTTVLTVLAVLHLGATLADDDDQDRDQIVDEVQQDGPKFDVVMSRSGQDEAPRGKPVSISIKFEDGSTQEVDISKQGVVTIDVGAQRVLMHTAGHTVGNAPVFITVSPDMHPPHAIGIAPIAASPAAVPHPYPVQAPMSVPHASATPVRVPLPPGFSHSEDKVDVNFELEKTVNKPSKSESSDQRLERLEQMIQSLQKELKSIRAESKPTRY